ncbi:hypothetical protein PL8927_610031 [Planktothrix serta PCC 8927]|uniref:Uncharacterized protein n=1 Tax=Planktothrix serta PCC 8927 TaxID=671068 RepID=A0A7Z9E049_9CYAN|nr:hypothetical protein PL8927_610031 [Planktothrix serta PCC 8927]
MLYLPIPGFFGISTTLISQVMLASPTNVIGRYFLGHHGLTPRKTV